jgi:dihydropteroate synthase
VLAFANGAEVLRVHDAGAVREALTVAEAILDRDRAAAIADVRGGSAGEAEEPPD